MGTSELAKGFCSGRRGFPGEGGKGAKAHGAKRRGTEEALRLIASRTFPDSAPPT
jgi:hypothetical protein